MRLLDLIVLRKRRRIVRHTTTVVAIADLTDKGRGPSTKADQCNDIIIIIIIIIQTYLNDLSYAALVVQGKLSSQVLLGTLSVVGTRAMQVYTSAQFARARVGPMLSSSIAQKFITSTCTALPLMRICTIFRHSAGLSKSAQMPLSFETHSHPAGLCSRSGMTYVMQDGPFMHCKAVGVIEGLL